MHPLRWQAVLETKTSVVFGIINSNTMEVDCTAWYPAREDPLLTKIRSERSIARSLPFFRYPVLSLKQEGEKNVIVITDLYFGANTHRHAAFELHSDGTVERKERLHLPVVQ
jgi:hypothetical protein